MITIKYQIIPDNESGKDFVMHNAMAAGQSFLTDKRLDHLRTRIVKEGAIAKVTTSEIKAIEFTVKVEGISKELEEDIKYSLGIT